MCLSKTIILYKCLEVIFPKAHVFASGEPRRTRLDVRSVILRCVFEVVFKRTSFSRSLFPHSQPHVNFTMICRRSKRKRYQPEVPYCCTKSLNMFEKRRRGRAQNLRAVLATQPPHPFTIVLSEPLVPRGTCGEQKSSQTSDMFLWDCRSGFSFFVNLLD